VRTTRAKVRSRAAVGTKRIASSAQLCSSPASKRPLVSASTVLARPAQAEGAAASAFRYSTAASAKRPFPASSSPRRCATSASVVGAVCIPRSPRSRNSRSSSTVTPPLCWAVTRSSAGSSTSSVGVHCTPWRSTNAWLDSLSKFRSSQTNRPAYLARAASANDALMRRQEYHQGAETSTNSGRCRATASLRARSASSSMKGSCAAEAMEEVVRSRRRVLCIVILG